MSRTSILDGLECSFNGCDKSKRCECLSCNTCRIRIPLEYLFLYHGSCKNCDIKCHFKRTGRHAFGYVSEFEEKHITKIKKYAINLTQTHNYPHFLDTKESICNFLYEFKDYKNSILREILNFDRYGNIGSISNLILLLRKEKIYKLKINIISYILYYFDIFSHFFDHIYFLKTTNFLQPKNYKLISTHIKKFKSKIVYHDVEMDIIILISGLAKIKNYDFLKLKSKQYRETFLNKSMIYLQKINNVKLSDEELLKVIAHHPIQLKKILPKIKEKKYLKLYCFYSKCEKCKYIFIYSGIHNIIRTMLYKGIHFKLIKESIIALLNDKDIFFDISVCKKFLYYSTFFECLLLQKKLIHYFLKYNTKLLSSESIDTEMQIIQRIYLFHFLYNFKHPLNDTKNIFNLIKEYLSLKNN